MNGLKNNNSILFLLNCFLSKQKTLIIKAHFKKFTSIKRALRVTVIIPILANIFFVFSFVLKNQKKGKRNVNGILIVKKCEHERLIEI